MSLAGSSSAAQRPDRNVRVAQAICAHSQVYRTGIDRTSLGKGMYNVQRIAGLCVVRHTCGTLCVLLKVRLDVGKVDQRVLLRLLRVVTAPATRLVRVCGAKNHKFFRFDNPLGM